MSGEVVFNEVWTEDHNPLPPSLLLSHYFIFPLSLSLSPLESDWSWQTERQRNTPSDTRTGEGRKGDGGVNGRERRLFFFSSSFFHYSIPPSITMWSQREQITGPVRDTLKIFSPADSNIAVYVCTKACAWLRVMGSYCVCLCAGEAGRVSSPLTKSLPTPTHNNPPQNHGFVVEDQPASLMHLKFVCLCVDVCFSRLAAWRIPLTNSVSAACPWFGWRAVFLLELNSALLLCYP